MKKCINRNYYRRIERCSMAIFILPLLLLIITSCEREKLTNSSEIKDNDSQIGSIASGRSGEVGFDYTKCDSLKNLIYKSGGMLVFTDEKHFEDCVTCLQKNYEDYNDIYEAQYPESTVEQLDDLDSINNFNPYAPFVTFEQSLGFNSYRAKIEAEIVAFEETPYSQVNINMYPDLNTPVLEESTRTFLNEDGKAKIGNDTLDVANWEESSSSLFLDDCGFLTSYNYIFTVADRESLINRQMSTQIKVRSGLFTSSLIGKRIFRKKIGSKYKRRRATTLTHEVTGQPYIDENNCECCRDENERWYRSKGTKKRRKVRVKAKVSFKWREALVCRDNENYEDDKCEFAFWWKAPSGAQIPFSIALWRDYGCGQ